MAIPNMKRILASRKLKLGHSVFEFNTPGLGQIIAAAGVDFIFMDMEHSGFGIADVKLAITGFRAGNLPVMVRPPSNAYHHIARVLDVGADGVVMPMVGCAEEAAEIVNCMKYPPMGKRGVALNIAHDRYTPGDTAAGLAAANRRTAFAALIETEDGLRNVDSIAGTKGVDCIWIGHFDLSCSLGIPGEFDHPEFKKASAKVKRAARKHNKALGRLTGTPEETVALHKQGYDLLCYSGDVWVYQQALIAGISEIRQKCKG